MLLLVGGSGSRTWHCSRSYSVRELRPFASGKVYTLGVLLRTLDRDGFCMLTFATI